MLRPRVIPEVFCVRQCVKQVDPETVLSKQIHDQQQVESRTVVSLFKLTWGMHVLYYYYYDPFFTQMTLMSYFKHVCEDSQSGQGWRVSLFSFWFTPCCSTVLIKDHQALHRKTTSVADMEQQYVGVSFVLRTVVEWLHAVGGAHHNLPLIVTLLHSSQLLLSRYTSPVRVLTHTMTAPWIHQSVLHR